MANPAATPVTTPVDEPIVATVTLLLAHVPPVLALLSVVVAPVHTDVVPVIAAGSGFTVTTIDLAQPVPSVYIMVDVPVVSAVATPDEFIVTTLVFDELHVPPVVLLL